MEIALTIYGGFVATLIGVYWSIHLTKEIDYENEQKQKEKILISSLKLLYSELDVNEMTIKALRKAMSDVPNVVKELFENYMFLSTISSAVKTEAFYAVIASGDMREITNLDKIFNSLQHAYFNMGLAVSGLTSSMEAAKEYIKPNILINVQEELIALKMLENDKKKVDRILKLIYKAKNEIIEFLSKKGVKFSTDTEIQNL